MTNLKDIDANQEMQREREAQVMLLICLEVQNCSLVSIYWSILFKLYFMLV